jgi:hypothetical protein
MQKEAIRQNLCHGCERNAMLIKKDAGEVTLVDTV